MNTVNQMHPFTSRYILGMRVDATNYRDAIKRIVIWAKNRQSKAVYAANVHMTMETYDNRTFADIVNSADIVAPNGKPLVWALRALGVQDATQVYGPDLTLEACQAAAREGIAVGLYGGTPASLVAFTKFLHKNFPGIQIVSQISPPFRPLTPAEDAAYTQ